MRLSSSLFQRILILAFFFLSGNQSLQAQSWTWARHADNLSGTSPYYAKSVNATDGSGNVFVAGNFINNSLALGGYTVPGSTTFAKAYIAKYNASGSVLWAKTLDTVYSSVNAIATDAAGNLYVSGLFADSITIGSTVLYASYPAYPGGSFLAKLDPSGNVLWATGGKGGWINVITPDAMGNVYVAGAFNAATMTLGTFTFTNVFPTNNDIFLARYDAYGNLIWAKKEGGTTNEYCSGIVLDGYDLYVVGMFINASSTIFNGTTYPAIGGSNLFLARYDLTGNFVSIKNIGHQSTAASNISVAASKSSAGTIMVAGFFVDDSLVLDTVTLTFTSPGTSTNFFVAQYNLAGDALWAKKIPTTSYPEYSAMTTDAANTYIACVPYDTTVIGGITVMPGACVVKYDHSGNVGWVKSSINGNPQSLSADAAGNVYLSGTFYSPPPNVTVFGSDTLSGTSTGINMFIAKLGSTLSTPIVSATGGSIVVYPNPNNGHMVVDFNKGQYNSLQLFDCLGRQVYAASLTGSEASSEINMQGLANGVYYLLGLGIDHAAKVPVVINRQ